MRWLYRKKVRKVRKVQNRLAELIPRRVAGTFTIEEIGAAMRRSRSGPALALAHYFDNPNGQRLEQLTRAVLYDFGGATVEWEVFAGDILAAAKDSRNHPTGCACDRCGSEGAV